MASVNTWSLTFFTWLKAGFSIFIGVRLSHSLISCALAVKDPAMNNESKNPLFFIDDKVYQVLAF